MQHMNLRQWSGIWFCFITDQTLFHYTIRNGCLTTHLFLLSVMKRLYFKVSSQAFCSFLNDRIFFANSWLHNTTWFLHVLMLLLLLFFECFFLRVSRLWWRRKRKENTVIQKRKGKVFSCPISLNMFTRNALICTKKESDKTISCTRAHI